MTLEEMAIKKLFIIIMNIMAIFGNAQMMTANQGYNIWNKWWLLMWTFNKIRNHYILNFWPAQSSACRKIFDWLENCSLFQWRRFWMYWEMCVCLCLEGLRWVTWPLGRNCRGNLEVFLLRKLILWEQPDLHIIISVDFLLLQNIWVHFLFFSWDDLTSISGYGQQASLVRFWLRMAGSTEFHKTQKMLTLWQGLEWFGIWACLGHSCLVNISQVTRRELWALSGLCYAGFTWLQLDYD